MKGGWHEAADGNPAPGEYLVVDRVYRVKSVAVYMAALGWCILGRWRGHDAVWLWHDLPELPKPKSKAAP